MVNGWTILLPCSTLPKSCATIGAMACGDCRSCRAAAGLAANAPAVAMHRATSPSDVGHPQAIRDLAAYLATAPANPQPERGDGSALAAGEKVFQRQCVMCHGKAAQGSSEEPIPALAGQHYAYTLAQLQNFAMGHRGQVEPPVIDFTAGLSEQDRSGIADYLSRLGRK